MPKIKPFNLEPLVGYACWHFEQGATHEKVMELFRRHPVYSQRSDDDLRKAARRALRDLARWQKIRHCCGWIEGRGSVSWDEANREMKREQLGRNGSGHGAGDSPGGTGGTGGG